MAFASLFAEILVKHPQVGVMLALGVYIGYEIRFGRLRELEQRLGEAGGERHILGVAVFKLVKDDPELNEERFRDYLWGDESAAEVDDVWPADLSKDGSEVEV